MKKSLVLGLALLAGGTAQAATILVTPSNLQGWGAWDMRNTATAGVQNFVDDLGGSGALQLNMPTANADKAEWAIGGDFGILSELTGLSYSWYRDASSNNPQVQAPALKLLVEDEGQYSLLVYEPVYSTAPADYGTAFAEDAWHITNAYTGNFWARWTTGGQNQETYVPMSTYINTVVGANDKITGNARVLGFIVGGGSGWNGAFSGYVDHISYSFNSAEATTWDFSTASAVVPIPAAAPLGLLGMGLIGLARKLRKKSA